MASVDLSIVNISLQQFQTISSGKYVEQKLRTAVNRLPPDFRLDLEPTTTFSAVLN